MSRCCFNVVGGSVPVLLVVEGVSVYSMQRTLFCGPCSDKVVELTCKLIAKTLS